MSTTIKVDVKVKEFKNWSFQSMHITEKVGESLPTGNIVFLQESDDQDLSIESLTIDVLINNTYQLTMKAFVEEVHNYQGQNNWRLTFVPKPFYMDSHINEFNGVNGMIQSLCPYDTLNSPASDCGLGGVKLYQNNVTDFTYIIKYLKALQKYQVYSFRCDGLYFTDLTKKPADNSKINIAGIARYIPLKVRRNKFATLKAESAGLNDNSLTNIHYSNQVIAMNSVFAVAYQNYLENQRIYKCLEDTISYEFPDYMNLRAGDLVKLVGSNYESNNYLVTENDLDLQIGMAKNKITFSAI